MLLLVLFLCVQAGQGRLVHPPNSARLSALGFHICEIPGICDDGEVCVRVGSDANCELVEICQEDSCPVEETCVENDDKETFTCVCQPGTTRNESDDCVPFCDLPQPCAFDLMECIPTNTSYECACVEGYSFNTDKCSPVCLSDICPDGMECLLEPNNTISCLCPDGETPDTEGECQKSCDLVTCPEHMQCSEAEAAFSCECGAGFRFTEDEQCVPECEAEPCTAGQSCVSYQGQYRCCDVGHLPDPSTETCTPVCDIPDVCEEGLDCLADNINGSYSCVCPDSKVLNEDGQCVELCELELCQPGMECSSHENGFNCTCVEKDCQRCETNPCEADFVCVQLDDFSHECRCDEGYKLAGGRCVDVDECARAADLCVPGAVCTNTDGGYFCSCPGGTYYNDAARMCSGYDECLADACDTVHTGMLCQDLPLGFACVCPPEFSEEQCAQGEEPCWCGDHEECVLGQEANFTCLCDHQSILSIGQDGSAECVSDLSIPPAALISLAKHQYTFNLGQKRHIQVKIEDAVKKVRPWELVTWESVPGFLITTGSTRTPEGHFATPFNRRFLVLGEVRPEDAGLYRVSVQRDGFRTVSQDVEVSINDVLVAEFGPKTIGNDEWKFQVKVQANLDELEVTWLRIIGDHYQLLTESQDTSIEWSGNGRTVTLKVPRVLGTYVARLSGQLKESGAVVTSEVGFQADSLTNQLL